MSRTGRLRAAAATATLLVVGVSALTLAQEREGEAAAGSARAAPSTWSGRCAECHVEEGWSALKAPDPAVFDHALTGFRLRGAHRDVQCSTCHSRGLSALTSSCSACHHDPHAGQNSLRCDACHTARDWQVARGFFVHERTRFPLTGVHATLACEACHRPARAEPLAATPTECLLCHVRDRARARPNHVIAGFTDCGTCHTTATFAGATYRHQSYPQAAAHGRAACVDCHTGSAFAGLAGGGADCITCHLPDYQSTSGLGGGVPDHVASGYATDCTICHDNVEPPRTFNGANGVQ